MSLVTEIKKPSSHVFRRAYIRRRQSTDGLFEPSWLDITSYVKKFGSIDTAVDDVKLNRFKHSGITLKVSNNEGAFNREDNINSLWNGYLTRYGTLIKVEAGYTADDGTEYPTDSSQGIFVLNDEIPLSGLKNDLSLRGKSMITIFDDVRARDVAGLNGSFTASEIVTKFRDHTDGSGISIFQQYISAGAWLIQGTTQIYDMVTSTSLDEKSVWKMMELLAESEGYVVSITRTGGVEFRNRDPRTTLSSFDFTGLGFKDVNIKSFDEYSEALDKTFNFFRVKHGTEDTTTSYADFGTLTSVNATNPSWKYGQRVYEFTNTFLNSTTADATALNLYTLFHAPLNEVRMKTKFIPHMEILDRVALYHRSYSLVNTILWNQFNWNESDWGSTLGENFDFDGDNYKILKRKINLDKFECSYTMREIVT